MPSLKRRLRPLLRHPTVRRLRRRVAIVVRHHRLRPSRITIEGTERVLHVDPRDPRGWRLVTGGGRGPQPKLIDLWVALVRGLEPDTAIDVGVNYGEFLFPLTYPPGTRIIGIEANRRLATWIDRSVAEHPDGRRMEVRYALASDAPADAADFWIDPTWSGRSTAAIAGPADPGLVHDDPPALAIDDLFGPGAAPVGGLVFKIDTEGYEATVLRGMAATLDAATWSVGIIEFDTRHLARSGVDPADVLAELVHRFLVLPLDPGAGAVGQVDPADPWASLQALSGDGTGLVSADLLLVSDPATRERVTPLLPGGLRTAAGPGPSPAAP